MQLVEFSYPAVDLSIYDAPNYSGRCMVSFYENDKTLCDSSVYIVDIDRCFEVNLYDEKLAVLDKFPSAGEVFLVDLGNDGFHRVVCNENLSLLFIDSGEILQMPWLSDLNIFSLSDRAQKMSARGIPCKVTEILDELEKPIVDLAKVVHQQIWYTVHNIEHGNLVVTLRRKKPVGLSKKEKTRLQLTREDVDMLYEEPEVMTSNALRAVAGHVPRDETLICPFYDYNTGACFKGNSCHLLHVPPLRDGTTRDRKETKHKILDQAMPKIGSTYKVAVTCIESADEFYVYIPEMSAKSLFGSLEEFKKKLNASGMVEQYQPFIGTPSPLELVLIRHKDIYYRGKIIQDHCEDYWVILFIDYGSIELINRKDIFQWYSRWETTPALAYRCFLENIRLKNKNDSAAMQALRNLILNGNDITAQIISCASDLYVRLYDEQGFDVGETLCANGFALLAPRIVAISTQFPG